MTLDVRSVFRLNTSGTMSKVLLGCVFLLVLFYGTESPANIIKLATKHIFLFSDK